MKIYYYYDANGVYSGAGPAGKESAPPDNCLLVRPPEKPGFHPVLNQARNGWVLRECHQQERCWRKADAVEVFVDCLGSLPNTVTTVPAPPDAIDWNEETGAWNRIEDHRGEFWYNAETGEEVPINDFGPIPAGLVPEKPDLPPPPDTRTPEEKRRDAYEVEADGFFQQYQFYQAEADGWEALGDAEKTAQAQATAADHLRLYVLKKEEIRNLYPDTPEDSA